MIPLFNLILNDPLKGIFVIIILFVLYLWREQGKIKTEIRTMERFLDDKKVDKSDFKTYVKTHQEDHKSLLEHIKIAIDLLKDRR